jgi:hypothetical protein
MSLLLRPFAFAVIAALAYAPLASADITVGVTLSATGPAASLGIPERNTFELLPSSIGGEKVRWIVLDDASDTTRAVTNTRKFISEEKVDVIVGSTVTPNSLAMVDIAAERRRQQLDRVLLGNAQRRGGAGRRQRDADRDVGADCRGQHERERSNKAGER